MTFCLNIFDWYCKINNTKVRRRYGGKWQTWILMLVISSGECLFIFQILLLIHLLKKFDLIWIDLVQILAPPVRNRTIPVFWDMEKGNRASSFWNYNIPNLDQISSGDGWCSTWAIESGWRWNGSAETIRNNQHKLWNKFK